MTTDLCQHVNLVYQSNVMGIGGSQKIAEPVSCIMRFGSFQGEFKLNPIEMSNKTKCVLLGRNFLEQFKETTFDWINRRVKLGNEWICLVDSVNEPGKSSVSGVKQVQRQYEIEASLEPHQVTEVESLVESYRSVFAINNKAPRLCTNALHVINSKVEERPQCDKVRRLPQNWIPHVQSQVKEMEANGIIRKSKSPYNNNILLVNKPDKSKRFVLDFRNLNKNTIRDTYPLPNVDDLIEACYGSRYFSQIDLASGYWAIKLREEDKEKTAFSTPNGKYEFNVMPYGMVNAGATFQRKSDDIVSDMKDLGHNNAASYSDNFILHHETYEEHIKALEDLFRIMAKHNLSLREDKCQFMMKSILFLGFIIDGVTVKPDPKNVEKVKNFPVPNTRRQLQQFIGLAGFNRKFLENMAEVCKPLTDLTSNKVKFKWTSDQQKAFEAVKEKLTVEASLYIPDWKRKFYMRVDASNIALGALLYQISEEKENKPIAYASKALTKEKLNWSATEKEFFGLIWVTRKWQVYCTNRPTIFSDHLSVQRIREQKDPRNKFSRWIIELESINCEISFLKGSENIEADCLSRVLFPDEDKTSEEINPEVIYELDDCYPSLDNIKKCQRECKDLGDVMKCLEDDKEVKCGPYSTYTNLNIRDGVLLKGNRTIIPESLQENIIKEVHGQYHYGAPNTMELIKTRFYWKGMKKQVEKLVKSCETCIQCKRSKQPKAKLTISDTPNARRMMSMDLGTMPRSLLGNRHFLLMIDMNTKFIVTSAIPDMKAETIEKEIIRKWIAYFGVPEAIISDQGNNIDGETIRELCVKLKIKKLHSSPWHPQGNSSSERGIQSMKNLIRCMTRSRDLDIREWDTILPEAGLAANSMNSESTHYPPFKIMFGEEARLPFDNLLELKDISEEEQVGPQIIQQNATLNRYEAQLNNKRYYDKDAKTEEYAVGQEVLVKRTFGPFPKANVRWLKGPYIVEKKIGPVNYHIVGPNKFSKVLHHDLLMTAKDIVEAQVTPDFPSLFKDNATSNVSPPTLVTFIPTNMIDRAAFRANVFNNNMIEGGDISENISNVIGSDVDNINADSIEIYDEDCDNSEVHESFEHFEEEENIIPSPVRPLPLMLRRLQG